MNKTNISLLIAAAILLIAAMLLSKNRKPQQPIETEIDRVVKTIERLDREIHDLKVELSLRSDTVKYYETLKPIIKNNYFTNEKNVLAASDSVNAVLRQSNQREFERRYFSGRYAPTK